MLCSDTVRDRFKVPQLRWTRNFAEVLCDKILGKFHGNSLKFRKSMKYCENLHYKILGNFLSQNFFYPP
jgi:hypothetical protein